jgi:hypothetical protein
MTSKSHILTAPASFAQERLLMVEALVPGNPFYVVPLAYRLRGDLDEASLGRALDEIVRRHEILRTIFAREAGTLVQVVLPPMRVDVSKIDLSDHEDPFGEALRRARTVPQPFDLFTEPGLRVGLTRLSAADHLLTVDLHHALVDGASTAIFAHELGVIYSAYRTGQAHQLPGLPAQHCDFSVWQRGIVSTELGETQLDYWVEQLLDAPFVLDFPADHPRPRSRSFSGMESSFDVPAEIATAVQQLSRRLGVTQYMICVAVFAVLLSDYTGNNDMLIGVPYAGRPDPDFEPMIALFTNTLLLRVRVHENDSLAVLVTRVADVALDAYSNADIPLEEIVRRINPDRDSSLQPLVQTQFQVIHTSHDTQMVGLTVQPVRIPASTCRFDMEWALFESLGSLHGIVIADSELFSEATLRRIARDYVALLSDLAIAPERPIRNVAVDSSLEVASQISQRPDVVIEPTQASEPGTVTANVEVIENGVWRSSDSSSLEDLEVSPAGAFNPSDRVGRVAVITADYLTGDMIGRTAAVISGVSPSGFHDALWKALVRKCANVLVTCSKSCSPATAVALLAQRRPDFVVGGVEQWLGLAPLMLPTESIAAVIVCTHRDGIHTVAQCAQAVQSKCYSTEIVHFDVGGTSATLIEDRPSRRAVVVGASAVKVLDEYLRPAPPGRVGTLHIVPRVLSDYPSDVTTAMAAVETTFLARWSSAGIEIVGRRETTARYRGCRVDLSETAVQLRSHPLIADAFATVATTEGLTSFRATIVPTQPLGTHRRSTLEHDLRELLRERLPGQLLPELVWQESPDGAVASDDTDTPRAYFEGESGRVDDFASATLGRIWADIGLTADSRLPEPSDDFFDLGGHSLLAFQMVELISERLSIDVPFRLVFDYPIFGAMAMELTRLLMPD